MKQTLIPNPGKIIVRRLKHNDFYSYRFEEGVDRMIDIDDRPSIWALVVGVGKSETTMYGTKITTDVVEGDFVAVAQIGVDLKLEAGDGSFDYVYVIPFDGVISRLEAKCEIESCGYSSRANPRQLICPKCGAGPVKLVAPTLTEVANIMSEKGR